MNKLLAILRGRGPIFDQQEHIYTRLNHYISNFTHSCGWLAGRGLIGRGTSMNLSIWYDKIRNDINTPRTYSAAMLKISICTEPKFRSPLAVRNTTVCNRK